MAVLAVRTASIFSVLAMLLVGVGGCGLGFEFNECTYDEDCARRLGIDVSKIHCDANHFCIAGMSPAILCPETAGIAGEGSLVIASVVNRNDEFDLNIEKAFRLAVDQINFYQAGHSQPPIELRICNTAGESEQTLNAVKLAHDSYRAAAVLGPTSSDAVIAITSFIAQNSMLVMSPSATAISISSLQDNGFVWRTAPSDVLQARLLAKLVKGSALPPTKVDTFYVNNVYGSGLSDAFVSAYASAGGPNFKRTISFEPGGAELAAKLALLGTDNPSHTVLVADYDGPALFAELGHGVLGLDTTRFFATDSLMTEAIFGPVGNPVPAAVLDRVEGTAPATPSGVTYDLFLQAFSARYGSDPSSAFTANAYDAAYLIAIAAGATVGHVPTGPELVAGLKLILPWSQCDDPVKVTSNDYLRALQRIEQGGVCLDGASGPLEFDANGDTLNGTFQVWAVDTTTIPYKFKTLPTPP